LLALEVGNVACGVERHGEGGQALQEIDLVANHGGRLEVIDCKLRTERDEHAGEVETITSQIRQAAQTRRDLGGLGARLVWLRPNRTLSPEERALAEAYGLDVLDRRDVRRDLFGRLANVFGVGVLPEEIQRAGEEVRRWLRDGHTRLFTRELPEV